ncbi:hypothetical protein K461DRAFT_291984 [Myriangium duriaei CBS 260.36]|uniref:Uncharacterized protein n=1 Tax=Myriangium duriaei CBS 260.36 TaxID=1168546 RepID=A0A9P4MJD2_9PEZI|nr:hypothetical protein K461DRAFT_291984 [Myriangium duriaei CBS 260.36]
MPYLYHGGDIIAQRQSDSPPSQASTMADGLNNARAMRVAEIIQDYRNIQAYFSSLRVSIPSQYANTDGYLILRQCIAEASHLLSMPYSATSTHPQGDAEREKTQLRQVLLDAGVRRHRAHKNYLRAIAAQRWIASRDAVLRARHTKPEHAHAMLLQATQALRNEIQSITDSIVERTLRSHDQAQGKWLAEDPSLAIILQMLQRHAR